jgi:formylglycine-generating enzyme required for sulfatase activity
MLAALRSAQTARPRPIPDPTARPVPATLLVDPNTVAQGYAAAPPMGPAAPPRHFPVLWVGLVSLGVLAVAAVGVFIFTAISLYGPRPAASATPAARRTATVPAVVAPTGVPSATLVPKSTLPPATVAPTTVAPPTNTPAPTPSPEPVAGATRLASLDNMMQVYVPAGPFTMGNDQGAPDQRPAHTVSLNGFWIDRTEVTNDMYGACVRANICAAPQQLRSISRLNYFGSISFTNFPVLFVTWTQAQTYCKWAGRRLPTEAEWEKAARGTDGRLYPWGNQPPDPQRLNFGASGLGDTVAVGQHPTGASPYGALDMAGNAWEWVADWYDPGYYAVSPPDNPPGPAKTGCPNGDCKVLRGGGWDSSAQDVTVTTRLFYGPNDTRDAFTIRCAQS